MKNFIEESYYGDINIYLKAQHHLTLNLCDGFNSYKKHAVF